MIYLTYSKRPEHHDRGIARFNFPNINLPDSNSNEPLSHGYIQYKIKLKDSTAIGTQIKNTGYIYFDFNIPAVTNTTMNTVVSPVGIQTVLNHGLKVAVYPNPTKGTFTIYGLQFPVERLELYNLVGEKLFDKACGGRNTAEIVDLSGFPSGMYFVKVFTEEGNATLKVVKE